MRTRVRSLVGSERWLSPTERGFDSRRGHFLKFVGLSVFALSTIERTFTTSCLHMSYVGINKTRASFILPGLSNPIGFQKDSCSGGVATSFGSKNCLNLVDID